MPVYEYTHTEDLSALAHGGDPNAACPLGQEFETTQSIKDDALTACPRCGRPIQRQISRTFISSPKSDSDLRNMGFTKLVKRDTGVYENVTRRGTDHRYMESGKPDSIPDLKKTITD